MRRIIFLTFYHVVLLLLLFLFRRIVKKINFTGMIANVLKCGLVIFALTFCFLGCAETFDYSENRSVLKTKTTLLAYFGEEDVFVKRMSSFKQNFEYKTFRIGVDSVSNFLDMDIYGCNDLHCLSATSIVFHDKNYEYVEVLEKGEFEFLEPTEKIYTKEFGEDCEVRIASYWNLNIDTERIKIEWLMLEAEEVCDVILYK